MIPEGAEPNERAGVREGAEKIEPRAAGEPSKMSSAGSREGAKYEERAAVVGRAVC